MTKNFFPIPLTLAVITSGIAMENPNEQDDYYQTALEKLEALGQKQKEETNSRNKYNCKTSDFESLKENGWKNVEEILSHSPDRAREEAYKLADYMDRQNEKRHNTGNDRVYEPAFRNNIVAFEMELLDYERKRKSTSPNSWSLEPSLTIFFLGQPVIGIGHHLFIRAMENKIAYAQHNYPMILPIYKDHLKQCELSTQQAKNDFIRKYSTLSHEDTNRIKEIAEMKGIDLYSF